MMFFVHVSGRIATWNLLSVSAGSSNGGGGGNSWNSTVVAMTNAP